MPTPRWSVRKPQPSTVSPTPQRFHLCNRDLFKEPRIILNEAQRGENPDGCYTATNVHRFGRDPLTQSLVSDEVSVSFTSSW
jgi:hypothetical protein